MAGHEKVFGVCENKCFVEVRPKTDTYPKSEVYTKSDVYTKNETYSKSEVNESINTIRDKFARMLGSIPKNTFTGIGSVYSIAYPSDFNSFNTVIVEVQFGTQLINTNVFQVEKQSDSIVIRAIGSEGLPQVTAISYKIGLIKI